MTIRYERRSRTPTPRAPIRVLARLAPGALMSDAPKPLHVADDVGTALVRLVLLAEALAVHMDLVNPADVPMEVPDQAEAG